MKESCHTHVDESWHASEWVMAHIWMRHVTHMNESWHTHEWVMAHIWMSHVAHMDESCHTYECVISHRFLCEHKSPHFGFLAPKHYTYEWVISHRFLDPRWPLRTRFVRKWNGSRKSALHTNPLICISAPNILNCMWNCKLSCVWVRAKWVPKIRAILKSPDLNFGAKCVELWVVRSENEMDPKNPPYTQTPPCFEFWRQICGIVSWVVYEWK